MSVGIVLLLALGYLALNYFGAILVLVAEYMFGALWLSWAAFVAFALLLPAALSIYVDSGLGIALFVGGACGGLLRYATIGR